MRSRVLKSNIKSARERKGLSQEELAASLHVVRQTVSKWERGLSVPDAEMLISIAKILETSVDTLLGENTPEPEADDIRMLSEKVAALNAQLLQKRAQKRKVLHWLLISLCVLIIIIFVGLFLLKSPYLGWDYGNPENAVLGVAFHSFEWIFVRMAPIVFILLVIGVVLTSKKP